MAETCLPMTFGSYSSYSPLGFSRSGFEIRHLIKVAHAAAYPLENLLCPELLLAQKRKVLLKLLRQHRNYIFFIISLPLSQLRGKNPSVPSTFGQKVYIPPVR